MSVAVKVEMATVSEVDVEGRMSPVTTGAVVSPSVMTVDELELTDTFPAASFAHA